MATYCCAQSLPLDCLGLAKAAALVRIGNEHTALALTLGPSQPDTMLPPDAIIEAAACRHEDVAAGAAAVHDAVRAAFVAANAVGTLQGAPALNCGSVACQQRSAADQLQTKRCEQCLAT